MKRFLLVLTLFLMPSQVFASGDICSFGEKTLNQTSFELKDFFEDEIKDGTFRVDGRVRNVSPKSSATSLYDVKIDCGNDIIVVVATGSSHVEKLRVGDRESFDCKIYKYIRRFYRASDKVYIKFWCFD